MNSATSKRTKAINSLRPSSDKFLAKSRNNLNKKTFQNHNISIPTRKKLFITSINF